MPSMKKEKTEYPTEEKTKVWVFKTLKYFFRTKFKQKRNLFIYLDLDTRQRDSQVRKENGDRPASVYTG